MSLEAAVCERLVDHLRARIEAAGPGFCMRVDHLSRDDARVVCSGLRAAGPADLETHVLGQSEEGEFTVASERAVEIRELKTVRFCLFVPSGTVVAAASSLANSFEVFDLEGFWTALIAELQADLEADLVRATRLAMSQLRGLLAVPAERKAHYLAAVSADPSLHTAGRELWRLGLIPDLEAETFTSRLDQNARCARELIRPARAQATAVERLTSLRVREGAVRDELLAYLAGKSLRDGQLWLRGLANEPYRGRITFERWLFEHSEQSDLERIDVLPLLNKQGEVEKYTSLLQPNGAGGPLFAQVGSRGKVAVKWGCQPEKPSNLHRWRAELIPSREEYEGEDVGAQELPIKHVSKRTRRASIPLADIELEGIGFRAAQIRVVALDSGGSELRDPEGTVIEGLSQDFWLDEEKEVVGPVGSKKRVTTPNLPFGRLQAAMELDEPIEEAGSQWQEKELHYYCVTLNGRRVVRIGLSEVLKELEARVLDSPDQGGILTASVDVAGTLDLDSDVDWESGLLESVHSEAIGPFLASRRALFKGVRANGDRGFLETVAWTPELARKARKYAKDWVALIDSCASPEALSAVLRVDSLDLAIEHEGRPESSVVVLPTHPLRVLWFSAYAELLASWEAQLGSIDKKYRSSQCDIDLLERVEPSNCPGFAQHKSGSPYLFARNLGFFWGVALPVDVIDPARRLGDIARVLGLEPEQATMSDLPPERLTRELTAYLEIHPYLETLRVSVLNPGAGLFISDSLRGVYQDHAKRLANDEEGEGEGSAPLRMEVLCHAYPPIPFRLPAMERLQRDVYEMQPPGRRHHLAPYFSVALRSMDDLEKLPGGEVNVSIMADVLRPAITTGVFDDVEHSSGFYGLLARLIPRFAASEAGATWDYQFCFSESAALESHPEHGPYTKALVDAHRAWSVAVARSMNPDQAPSAPVVSVELSPEDRGRFDRVHHDSDWVVTLDRFFGVEYYDDPGELHLAGVARKYLLDYAPEFLEGLGHRMLVTTGHREEVEEILARAMRELGFGAVEDSVGDVLHHLKTISGRLALRTLGGENRAKEAVSLGVVAAYLRARGELEDSVLIPVDSHPELFAPTSRRKKKGQARHRCDLIRLRFLRNKIEATFIEVKSRSAAGQLDELCSRIADQVDATVEVFRDLFFRSDPPRLDHVLQRARLQAILRFYLRRALRYGLIASPEQRARIDEAISLLEKRYAELKVVRQGFVVNLTGPHRRPRRHGETEIRFITAQDLADAGFVSEHEMTERAGRAEVTPQSTTPRPKPAEPDSDRDRSRLGDEARQQRSGPSSSTKGSEQPEPGLIKASEPPKVVDVELGTTDEDGSPLSWRAGVKGSPHLFILGIPGQGKSWTTTRLLVRLAEQGLPALVVDFHGQFMDPDGPYAQIARPHVLDAASGLPFSPFEADSSRESGTNYWRTNCFVVAEIFQYVSQLGDIQRDVVYEALKNAYSILGFEDGWGQRVPTLKEFYDQLLELETSRGIKNVIPRCRPLLEFGLFEDEAANGPSLEEMLRGGLVVGVNNLGLETLQMAAGAFVLRKVYKDMFRWGEADRLRLVIVLDEAHRLARDITLPKIMKEGRKFGVGVIVASQGLADFHPDVVGNAGTKVVFRTNFPMSKKVAGFLRAAPKFDLASSIEQLDVGEAYVQTPEMNRCTRVRMHPLGED